MARSKVFVAARQSRCWAQGWRLRHVAVRLPSAAQGHVIGLPMCTRSMPMTVLWHVLWLYAKNDFFGFLLNFKWFVDIFKYEKINFDINSFFQTKKSKRIILRPWSWATSCE